MRDLDVCELTFKTAFNSVVPTMNCKETRKLLTYLNTYVNTGTFIELGIAKGRQRNPLARCLSMDSVFLMYISIKLFVHKRMVFDVFVMLLPLQLAIQLIVLVILNL